MTITKNIVDADLRKQVFSDLITDVPTERDFDDPRKNYVKINDRQYGILLTDLNGVERYCRIGVIVAEEREDMTAAELMQSEVDKYNAARSKKEKAAQEKAEKAARDKAKREEKAKEKEAKAE